MGREELRELIPEKFSDPGGAVLAEMKEGTIISMNRFQAFIQGLRKE